MNAYSTTLKGLGICDCGETAHHSCGLLHRRIGVTMAPCPKWLCSLGCSVHRHAPGTMGYSDQPELRCDFIRELPERGRGFFTYLRTLIAAFIVNHFFSTRQKATWVLDRMERMTAPPAPMPRLIVTVDGERFERGVP